MYRVVFDTNVFVSALITPKGTTASLFKFGEKFRSLISLPLLKEIVKTLSYPKISKKYGVSKDMIRDTVLALREHGVLISPRDTVKLLGDEMDNHLLALASEGKADFLVTGDAEIVDLGQINSTKIVSPKQFLGILKSS